MTFPILVWFIFIHRQKSFILNRFTQPTFENWKAVVSKMVLELTYVTQSRPEAWHSVWGGWVTHNMNNQLFISSNVDNIKAAMHTVIKWPLLKMFTACLLQIQGCNRFRLNYTTFAHKDWVNYHQPS